MKRCHDLNVSSLGNYFYKLSEHSQDVFWIRDLNFKKQLYISPAYEKIWGLSCASLYEDPDSWLKVVHPEDQESVQSRINEILNDPKEDANYTNEYRILCPNNEERWIFDSGFPLFDSQNQLLGYAGVAKDITHAKNRVVELEKATHFFRFFAERIQQAVFWAYDPRQNKQIYVSPSYEKIWGKSRESLYQNPATWIETLIDEDRYPNPDEMRINLMEKEGLDVKYEVRYRIYNAKGEVTWIKDTSFPIYDEKNQFIAFAGIAEDVTKEALHEQALQREKQRAEVANQAKSDFLAMVSHELRTPLNAILGMAQILSMKGLPGELKEYVDIISSAGNNLMSLVNDIIDFIKLEAGKLSFEKITFNLNDLIGQIVHSMQFLANEKGLSLSYDFPEDFPTEVISDPNRIRQILVNLISNAIKFTDQGQVSVAVRCLKKFKRKFILEVAVRDTGIGIKPEKVNFIFEKFSQINPIYYRKHQGLGLGLTITKELVEKMGGSIQVESEWGKGSTFTFKIPLVFKNPKHPEVIKHHHAAKEDEKSYNLYVLLVEDNLINQKIAKLLLENFGCQVDIHDNGAAVLANIDDMKKYDLVFMDIGLPDLSGFEIVSRLRQNYSPQELPIIAMTAHVLERDRQQAFSSGMNDILAKPISSNELAAVLNEYH